MPERKTMPRPRPDIFIVASGMELVGDRGG